MDDPGQATELLRAMRAGDSKAENELLRLLHGELRNVAARQLNGAAASHTLQPTALVHEAWMRLAKAGGTAANDRGHFLAVAARAMRTTLVDYARRKQAEKRGGGQTPEPLDVALDAAAESSVDPIELDELLERLAEEEPRQAKIVELRFFGGLTHEETAEVLGISRATVQRDWEMARMWLIWAMDEDDQ